jgi:hypothetical protein
MDALLTGSLCAKIRNFALLRRKDISMPRDLFAAVQIRDAFAAWPAGTIATSYS